MRYEASAAGIGPADRPGRMTWAELSDVLATIMSPRSSAHEVRSILVAALEEGRVEGRSDLLQRVLAETAPRLVSDPDFENEEIAQVTGKTR